MGDAMSALPDLIRRQRATQATLTKYRARPFDWKRATTCIHMARFHLRQMGHAVPVLPRIRGAIGATRALKANGWASVVDMLDAQVALERIAPAFMRVGDLAVLPSDQRESGLDAIVICAGVHKLLGWHQDWTGGMIEMEAPLDNLLGAWRA
jgi:hypothetical protein